MVQCWVWTPALLHTGWVILGKFNLSVLCFPPLQNEEEICLGFSSSNGPMYMDGICQCLFQ